MTFLRPTILLGCALITLAACSDPAPAPPTPSGTPAAAAPSGNPAAAAPAGTPSPAVTPGPDPRAGRVIEGDGYRIVAPAAFQRRDLKSSNGEPMLQLNHPSSEPAVPAIVAVLREPRPPSDLLSSTYALEVTKRTAEQATAVTRSQLDWPGAEQAVLVQWTTRLTTTEGEKVPVRYWQLGVQTPSDLQLAVVGFAPEADFAGSGIAEAFSSFRIDS